MSAESEIALFLVPNMIPGGSMKQISYLDRVTVFVAILFLCLTSSFYEPKPAHGQEVLRGLDLSEVGLVIRTPFHKDLLV